MTEPGSKFEEEIRHALRTAGDLVVPAGDGLHKIRERTVYRPRPLAWLLADLPYLLSLPFAWLRMLVSEIAAIASGHSSLAQHLRSARRWPRALAGSLRSPGMWLRPVLSATAALLLVLAVTLAVPRLRGAMSASLTGGSSGVTSGHSGGGHGYGAGSADSSSATGMWPVRTTPGQPVDALMPSRSSRRCASGGGAGNHSGTVPYTTPGSGPGPGQTVSAGTIAEYANAAVLGRIAPGGITQTSACTRTASPTTLPPSTPPTTPVTTPPTTPVTTPPTTPVTTPPTTPVTTPPSTSTSYGSSSPSGTASPG